MRRIAALGATVALALLLGGCELGAGLKWLESELDRQDTAGHGEGQNVPPMTRPGWIDADRDCQNTRTEVLFAEAVSPSSLRFDSAKRCKVKRGSWRCPYTGTVVRDPRKLDVDHMVPLKNAWISGASEWSKEHWRQYANELEQPEHLIAVVAAANRSKSARGPEEWLPPLATARCGYIEDWVRIKTRWELRMNPDEQAAIGEARARCRQGKVPDLPQAKSKSSTAPAGKKNKRSTAKKCCRTCYSGKACGDSCVGLDKTCHSPPGCACDD